ncbi:hypothetical protein ISN35_07115 [Xanthomonas translucens pv. undulosa]|uniref:hypothetical protein n=1 Tax=Xanthomonas campestris pv. translucens TaxID=343 RepID=UPI0006426AFA|nr:hypothetical protein [Xanthomonas translucens]AKK66275.1 hypothetical protein FD63_01570 [Xanthomonas translucens pv. undulosa]MBC3972175.1 hypothetical protein [Xanthomonas translucens pv. undulosa]MCT8272040.1 hypothetical protein [Xanthomonas translucens pv. undulosa]QEO25071.1 hypothetical protein F0H32_01585 [Xanthomonas translucens pv. undulosa]QSQ41833.1 hypothetical protein ISN33_00695 [Xanthomonas translucens pv. translucens]
MLSQNLKPIGFDTWEKESWDDYRIRLALPDDEATLEFYRQVFYDHFEHFNNHYPGFDLNVYDIGIEYLTAKEAYDRIKFFHNKPMTDWGTQYDYFKAQDQDYLIYQRMSQDLTPPFPPILIQSTLLIDNGWRVYGRDIHLIEGTHRVSYLRRMLELGEVLPKSAHKFVVLRPRFNGAA